MNYLIAYTDNLNVDHYEVVSSEDAMQIRVSELSDEGFEVIVGVITEETK